MRFHRQSQLPRHHRPSTAGLQHACAPALPKELSGGPEEATCATNDYASSRTRNGQSDASGTEKVSGNYAHKALFAKSTAFRALA
eukprot:9354848-Alexandrium_andersonii.AAC.1